MATEREYKMSPAAREGIRNYMREWRRKNPERNREIQQAYWERRALREREEREREEPAPAMEDAERAVKQTTDTTGGIRK